MMNNEDLLKQAKRIIQSSNTVYIAGPLAEALEFLRVYAGEKSSFYNQLSKVDPTWHNSVISAQIESILKAFMGYVENGLGEGISIDRKAQIDVVSDFLGQAHALLQSSDVHPAAPAVIIGAALEEFLRNWIEEASLSLGGKKPSLDSYKNVLREADLISKQDDKDITSWGGLRNHAAHGEWGEVSDRTRISIMLEGVNLFMRKYGKNVT